MKQSIDLLISKCSDILKLKINLLSTLNGIMFDRIVSTPFQGYIDATRGDRERGSEEVFSYLGVADDQRLRDWAASRTCRTCEIVRPIRYIDCDKKEENR